jgi:hypothetical protein
MRRASFVLVLGVAVCLLGCGGARDVETKPDKGDGDATDTSDKDKKAGADKGKEKKDKKADKGANEKPVERTWQNDFGLFMKESDALVKEGKKDPIKGGQAFKERFEGKTVEWTLTFRSMAEGKGESEVFFAEVQPVEVGDETVRPVSFVPNPAALKAWKGVDSGTRVSFMGKVVSAGLKVVENVVVGEVHVAADAPRIEKGKQP